MSQARVPVVERSLPPNGIDIPQQETVAATQSRHGFNDARKRSYLKYIREYHLHHTNLDVGDSVAVARVLEESGHASAWRVRRYHHHLHGRQAVSESGKNEVGQGQKHARRFWWTNRKNIPYRGTCQSTPSTSDTPLRAQPTSIETRPLHTLHLLSSSPRRTSSQHRLPAQRTHARIHAYTPATPARHQRRRIA